MTPAAPAMHPLTLRFRDAAAEAFFASEQARKSLAPVRIGLAVLCALNLGFYLLTTHLFPGVILGFGAGDSLHYVVGATFACAVVFALTYTPLFIQGHQLAMGLLACVLWIVVVRSCAQLPPAVLEARGYTMPLIFTFVVYSVFRMRMVAASSCGWLGALLVVGTMAALGWESPTAAVRTALLLAAANVVGMLVCWQVDDAARREFAAMRLLDEEHSRAERLLLNILPAPIAHRLKHSGQAIAQHSDGVTVLFADIVGFTSMSLAKSPQQLVDMLNQVFSEFDALADAHGLEKIKTIGDAYMAVAGLPGPHKDHAERAARMAVAMHGTIARVADEAGEPLQLRIGLHSGPVVAGVIGTRKFAYDLWGDTVNTASRMESHGVPGAIHCTEATANLLHGAFRMEPRGSLEIKGKGAMQTFLLAGQAA
jgi:adenylate cyclase